MTSERTIFEEYAEYPPIYSWVAEQLRGAKFTLCDRPEWRMMEMASVIWSTNGKEERLREHTFYRADATLALMASDGVVIATALWTGEPFNQYIVWVEPIP